MQYLLTEEEFKQRRVTEEEINARIKTAVEDKLEVFKRELYKSYRTAKPPTFDPWTLGDPEKAQIAFLKWLGNFLSPAMTAIRIGSLPDPTSPKAEGIK